MKLFFASDLHGSLTATQRMIDAFTASKADHLLLLGDLINFGPRNPIPEGHNPIAVAELLNQYAESIIAVRGNCDSEVDQMLLSFPIMSDYNIVLLPTGQKLFLTHGHQADWWNYIFWKWSRFMVRILWKPLNVMGIADPTSPAKNYKELIKVERRTKKWITENNNLITVVGHTHRPRFPEPGDIPFFNDGSCVHPRSITGMEIENGEISLIKWQISTTDDGNLKIVRVLLEGPVALKNYKTI